MSDHGLHETTAQRDACESRSCESDGWFHRGLGRLRLAVLAASVWTVCSSGAFADDPISDAGREWFEKHIRPVLVERCYECHNTAETQEGGLAVDHRQALLDGGFSGPAIEPGKPEESLLIEAIHQDGELRMPQDGPKLERTVIQQFERWIAMGAPDPRDAPPTAEELQAVTSWPALREKRKQWWSFQPIRDVQPPAASAWSAHPVDRFVEQKMREVGLRPSEPADKQALIRRASYVLTGLPPTPQQIESFLNDPSDTAYEALVDRLLDSPAFGERWARHWMDWFRYAESHGSEGDPSIPDAWRYRDYLIRALNDDVPYDQMVREHLAGDLLAKPRLSEDGKTNESLLGVAHYRFVQHGYAPTDALDEQVRFTENQIDVLSKAFLGLTVSCARCHDHKFDAISQADFYAMYGVMVSCRPALLTIDAPGELNRHRDELGRLKQQLRRGVAERWLDWIERGELRSRLTGSTADPAWEEARRNAAKDALHPLHAWQQVAAADQPDAAWQKLQADWEAGRKRLEERRTGDHSLNWKLAAENREAVQQNWPRHGSGMTPEVVSDPGAFTVAGNAELLLGSIYPSGVYSHLTSEKDSGLFTSPDFDVEMDELWVRVLGGNAARVRYAMQHYPRVSGPVYQAHDLNEDRYQWLKWDMVYWQGDRAYLELATAADIPVEARSGNARSWFGISEVVGLKAGQPAPRDEAYEFQAPLLAAAPEDGLQGTDQLAAVYETALRDAIRSWKDGRATDEQARFLNGFLKAGLLPNQASQWPGVSELASRYRSLEQQIPVPRRAPGVIEGEVRDQPLFVRGNHKQPADRVPRRFLEALDEQPFQTERSGRLNLAERILDERNPFTARVIANRIWHHVFGRGLVRSTDNFGRLGDPPSHPELLDYLAVSVRENDYSLKQLIRLLVTSQTFRQSTVPPADQLEHLLKVDPGNQWLSSMPVRRLEAESIRDALLAVSGQLEGLGEPVGGPPAGEDSRRRSVYVQVRRNNLSSFLSAFDAPVPFTTTGARDVTNVPAQSLTLMNDPFVLRLAEAWSNRIATDPDLHTDRERIDRMYFEAFGRRATESEAASAEQFLFQVNARRAKAARELAELRRNMTDLQDQIRAIEQPVREALLESQEEAKDQQPALAPIAEWLFDEDLNDHLGGLTARAVGDARIEDGMLLLEGQSFVMTEPLKQSLRAKTLEAWVRLRGLDQRGNGVMTVQTLNGVTFDSIVFAEREPRKWMAGSNNFQRTQDVGGDAESERVLEAPIHVAIVYAEDGSITIYRDGRPYGRSYKSSGPVTFQKDQSQVLFGLRHGTEGGRRGPLQGAIDRARLYDRALSAEEISASSQGASRFVSRRQVREALSEGDRNKVEAMDLQLEQLQNQAKQLAELGNAQSENAAWRDLALALFNFKEFIYLP